MLLYATAVAHADLDETEIDGFYDNGCPKDTSIDKLLPHKECDQYYECFHGALISRFCPNGLNFDADLEKCDWIGKADCHKQREEDNRLQLDQNNPSHATLICSYTESNGLLVAHKNCHQFNKCSGGRPLVLNCARDLLYNTVIQQCDMPRNVYCGKRIKIVNDTIITTTNKDLEDFYSIEEIDQTNADPSLAVTKCSARRSDGLLVPHEYCNKFYKCSGGVPMTITCPSTLLYNLDKELCDWPRNVDCEGRVTTYVEDNIKRISVEKIIDDEYNEISGDEEDIAIRICAAENTDGILVAHEKCNHFYKCAGNKPVALSCPGDLFFNAQHNYCDWNNNVDCGERIKPNDGEKYEDPRQANTICSAEGSDGVLVAHDHCNKFYKCLDGFAIVVKCPGILLYNLKSENCDWPAHVSCKDRTVPENQYSPNENSVDRESVNGNKNNVDSGSKYSNKNKAKSGSVNINNAAYTCEDENNSGKLLPHENCNQFYKCVESKAVALFCPINLFYNTPKQSCDWSYNVKCGNRLTPSNDSNGEGDRNNANTLCYGKLDGYVVPHENCSQFYKCINGKSYSMDCPPGLYYSAPFKVCDWPTNVDCGKRLTEKQLNKKDVRLVPE